MKRKSALRRTVLHKKSKLTDMGTDFEKIPRDHSYFIKLSMKLDNLMLKNKKYVDPVIDHNTSVR